jgi:hypothetical protein
MNVNHNNLLKFFRNTKPTEIEVEVDLTRFSSGRSPQIAQYLPPLNTIIFNTLPKHPKFGRVMAPKEREDRSKSIPTTFTWKGKKGMAEPFNQQQCGSCWALRGVKILLIYSLPFYFVDKIKR